MSHGNVRPLRGILNRNPIFARRWRTKWAAILETHAAQAPCTVLDVSVSGAKLRVDHAGQPGDSVSLAIGNNLLISARVVWSQHDWVGLCFVEEQPWVLDLIPTAEANRPSYGR